MRRYIITALLLLTLFCCRQRQQNERLVKVDYLSRWFNANEDSLYNEFVSQVEKENLCNTCDTMWGVEVYNRFDTASFMGKFTLEAKKFCDSIDVTYFYDKSTTIKTRILLSINYNRNYTKALDTILNAINPKHFEVNKYEQPDLTADVFQTGNIDVVIDDLRVDMKPHDTLRDLTVFIHGNSRGKTMTTESKQFLKRRLFGEELMLKKIHKVDFKFSDTINSNLPTLKAARIKLM